MDISPEYFEAFYDELSEGQKQHMTNKIYKETGLYPQKLKAGEPEKPREYKCGTHFTARQSGRVYVLTEFYVRHERYWMAVSIDTGMSVMPPAQVSWIDDNNLKEVLGSPKHFKVEK